MSLLNKNENTTSALFGHSEKIAGYVSVSINEANALSAELLKLNNEDLADWLNSKPFSQRMEEFKSHGELGVSLNATAELIEKFIPQKLNRVDVRPFQEKLADLRRELVITDGVFSLINFPQIENADKGSIIIENTEDYN
jgi:hypothetical protein